MYHVLDDSAVARRLVVSQLLRFAQPGAVRAFGATPAEVEEFLPASLEVADVVIMDLPSPAGLGARDTVRGGGGGAEARNCSQFRNFPHFPAVFPRLLCACARYVLVGALCLPCAEVLLPHRDFPAVFRNVSQLGLALPDRNPAPPPPACGPGAANPCDLTCAVDSQGTMPRVPSTLQPCPRPARARAYTQDDGIFRPPVLRWGLVAVNSPLGLGTGQSGSSASWWGREGRPHPRACSCMRLPAQPNPTPPPAL